jgi:tRNA 2-thiouridine synthesizing protein A
MIEKSTSNLDLRGITCPLNVVQTKQKLKSLQEGDVLKILLDSGDPLERVSRTVKDEGHKVLSLKKNDDDTYNLLVRIK